MDSASIITVIAGKETEDINFNFKAADTGIISGSVTDSNGEPLNGAELQAFKVDDSGNTINNWPDFHINLGGGSSNNGKYNTKLPVGNYKLRVKIWGGDKAYDVVYYNQVTDKNSASIVEVKKNKKNNKIDFIVTEATYATISGYVYDENSCLLYTSPSPRDLSTSRMPSSA